MSEKETPMPMDEMAVLKAAGDLGLVETDCEQVAATVAAALNREYESERQRPRAPEEAGKWNRRKRYVVAVVVAVVVGGAATAGYAALTGSSKASDGIGCYPGSDSDGGATVVGLDGQKATETCADVWARGEVVSGVTEPPAPLHACVSGDGRGPIRVLASSDGNVCEREGFLEDPNAGSDPASLKFGQFESELMRILEQEGFACLGPDRMRQLVEQQLAEHELQGWSIVESGSFDQLNRCATLVIDSDVRKITMFAGHQ